MQNFRVQFEDDFTSLDMLVTPDKAKADEYCAELNALKDKYSLGYEYVVKEYRLIGGEWFAVDQLDDYQVNEPSPRATWVANSDL